MFGNLESLAALALAQGMNATARQMSPLNINGQQNLRSQSELYRGLGEFKPSTYWSNPSYQNANDNFKHTECSGNQTPMPKCTHLTLTSCPSGSEMKMQSKEKPEEKTDIIKVLDDFERNNTDHHERRKNCWSFYEEVMLIGTVCEEFLHRGSLASSRSKKRLNADKLRTHSSNSMSFSSSVTNFHLNDSESRSTDVMSDDFEHETEDGSGSVNDCWQSIQQSYEAARLQLLACNAPSEKLNEIKFRSEKALNRHFKVMKKRHRFVAKDCLDIAAKHESDHLSQRNFGLHLFFEAWLLTFGKNSNLNVVANNKSLYGGDEMVDKVHKPHVDRNNSWSFFEEVILIGALMQRFLYFGSLVKKEKDCWSGIKYIFDICYTRFTSYFNNDKLQLSSRNSSINDLIRRELLALKACGKISIFDRSSSALQRHYKVMRTNRSSTGQPSMKALYFVWCLLPQFFVADRVAKPFRADLNSINSLFDVNDFVKMVQLQFQPCKISVKQEVGFATLPQATPTKLPRKKRKVSAASDTNVSFGVENKVEEIDLDEPLRKRQVLQERSHVQKFDSPAVSWNMNVLTLLQAQVQYELQLARLNALHSLTSAVNHPNIDLNQVHAVENDTHTDAAREQRQNVKKYLSIQYPYVIGNNV